MAEDNKSHWPEPLMMGECRVCGLKFACAECCGGWSFQERHYCEEHQTMYADTDPLWQ
jgi:hypothetical protein